MKDLEKELKELRRVVALWGKQQCLPARPLGAPADWTTNQRIHMEGPMVLVAYVAEDGLVGHQWEERPSDLRVFNAPVEGNARAGRWEWVHEGAPL